MNKQNNWPEQLINSELIENPEDWSEFCAPGSKAFSICGENGATDHP
jgi:hypothetical protein